ncbi:MAG: FAD-binding oxidoreductase [Deltaproteobacteria bacterium]|nr:FAD-binding oxidoreductase [Deltaproteobacteria bacterium]
MPGTVEEIKKILAICNQNKIALVPSGGRTGYSGGATAEHGEVIISLARLHKIKSVDVSDRTMVCEPGVTTEAVRLEAAKHGLFYPVDFASKGSSHIAGNVATNAGGIRVIRYGNTRDWVLGLKVITAAGEELALNGALYKNATGYDLRNLFIGSEGTLGIITEVTLKLTSPPKDFTTALCGISDAAACLQLLRALRSAGCTVNVIEYFERNALELVVAHAGLLDPFRAAHAAYVLLEVETEFPAQRERFAELMLELVESKVLADAVVAESQKQQQNLMALRERISETIGRQHVPHKNDIAVPVSSLPQFLSAFRECLRANFPNFELIIFGHVGDGNLHVNILKPKGMDEKTFFAACDQVDTKTFEVVQKFNGTISAEHGVGLLKKPYLHFTRSAQEIELMKKIKRLFDPNGILNPGKIFD